VQYPAEHEVESTFKAGLFLHPPARQGQATHWVFQLPSAAALTPCELESVGHGKTDLGSKIAACEAEAASETKNIKEYDECDQASIAQRSNVLVLNQNHATIDHIPCVTSRIGM